MGRIFVEHVGCAQLAAAGADPDRYVCACCGADIASCEALIWTGCMGRQQVPALLFRAAVNMLHQGAEREERLSSGAYLLVDVACRVCSVPLGWRYLRADEASQKYKEGASLLEARRLKRLAPGQKLLRRSRPPEGLPGPGVGAPAPAAHSQPPAGSGPVALAPHGWRRLVPR